MAEQPHTEQTIDHSREDQDTGNHHKPGAPDQGGADRLGGTRTGAENVEPAGPSPSAVTESAPAAESFDGGRIQEVKPLREVAPERDERNRL